MGEVSELTGLAPHVLRNWEKTYPQLKPKKIAPETEPIEMRKFN